MLFDNIIVGAGPTGLTLAFYLSTLYKQTCLLIDENESIGGCHRSQRVCEGMFAEHGPRIYVGAYLTLKHILKDLGTHWNQLFTRYHTKVTGALQFLFQQLSWIEIGTLGFSFLHYLFSTSYAESTKQISVWDYLNQHHFSTFSKDIIDRMCLMTDGAGAVRLQLYEFFALFNENFFYNMYQPKVPNDQGLFAIWKSRLLETNKVSLQLQTRALSIQDDNDQKEEEEEEEKIQGRGKPIQVILQHLNHLSSSTTQVKVMGKNIILCIPPKRLVQLLQASPSIFPSFQIPSLQCWAQRNSYKEEISLTFHWTFLIPQLKYIWGFPRGPFGIAFIILSDYMKVDSQSKTVLSILVTKLNTPSLNSQKTANQCPPQELIHEVWHQLRTYVLNDLPFPIYAFISPTNQYHKHKSQWIGLDTAFVSVAQGSFLHPQLSSHVYTVGIQNGYHHYHFTSFESAAQNAIHFLKTYIPDTEAQESYFLPPSNPNLITFRTILDFFIQNGDQSPME